MFNKHFWKQFLIASALFLAGWLTFGTDWLSNLLGKS